jgi:K+-transporting ATPase ATPase C chain
MASVRLTLATLLVCVAGYTALMLGVAQLLAPDSAQGSLIARSDGTVVGSRLLAQKFTQPHYFWPRPSAADFNASAAAGSNKSPTSADLTERARLTVDQYGASPDRPLPAELAAASGGGLDPHITERGALYQAPRVASARGVPEEQLRSLIAEHAFAAGGFLNSERIVNVLELNLALDGEVSSETTARH